MWVLPAEPSAEDLPRDRRLVQKARVDRMPHVARTLAAYLSVQPRDVLPFEHCRQLAALAGLDQGRTRELLAQLVSDGLLVDGRHGYRFTHEELAQVMYAELSEAQRVRAHRTLGELLLARAGDDPIGKLRACTHFLPSLLEVARTLRGGLTRVQSARGQELGSHEATVLARAELLLRRETEPERVLAIARDLTCADDGFLLLADGALLGPTPSQELRGWAADELARANDHDAELRTEEVASHVDPHKLLGGLRYFASPLSRGGRPGVLGVRCSASRGHHACRSARCWT